MAKRDTFVGIDQDSGYVRAVRLGLDRKSKMAKAADFRFIETFELDGEFSDEGKLFTALRQLRDEMSISAADTVVTCLSGKQTYAAQMNVKKLPDSEMKSMLKLELRKTMPFEPTVAVFDYRFLPFDPAAASLDGGVPIMVTSATNMLLNRHLGIYEKAGIKPDIVDVLPIAAANAFWSAHEGESGSDQTHVVIHIGSESCTIVIDGDRSPFFTRSFAFNMNSVANQAVNSPESAHHMNVLSEEINKSFTYYRNTFKIGNISAVTLMGSHAGHSALEAVGRKTGLKIEVAQAAQVIASKKAPPEAGKFDLAAALAMRAA